MNTTSPILSRLQAGRHTVSVEFFPPKTEEGARQIMRTAQALKPFGINFVSITYGAGGSTRERTIEYGELLKQLFDYDVMPHLTCVGHSRAELKTVLERYRAAGFQAIMALRGDPPKGETEFKPHPDGLGYASELVAFIRENFGSDFTLGVAGYPENHPESPDGASDLKWLQHKVAQGADFITTQLFFDNADYYRFVESCRAAGITVPVLPGIMPPLSLAQAKKFCAFCQSQLPAELEAKLAACGDDEAAGQAAGVDWAFGQISDLLKNGAPGFHLYILNRSESALELFERLRSEKLLD
jgi:methylenetetrahydrofolate reductase (NADPH)